MAQDRAVNVLVFLRLLSQRLALRPFSEESPISASGGHLERDEVSGACHLVEADAPNSRDLAIDARVVVAEETDARTGAGQEHFEAASIAHPAITLLMPRERHSGRCVVGEHHIDPFDLSYRRATTNVRDTSHCPR
jgi:hypothetical protein